MAAKPKIAFFEIKGWEKRFLKRRLKGYDIVFFNEPLTVENADDVKGFDVVSVFIYSRIDKRVLDKLPRLRLIVTRSTGFDHVDKGACEERKVVLCNVPFYGENTVAEHTFALILSLSRNLHKACAKTSRGDFSIEGLKGFDLAGKTLGIIGGGRIGLHVAKIARGFGMAVHVYDINRDGFLAEILGFRYVSLDDLLKGSDIISLHVPYNKHTHHLINRGNIGSIKKGALLINTSRGGVVDTGALIEALDSKVLGGVGLDVLEGEDLIKEEKQLLYDPKKLEVMADLARDHMLLSRDNVVYTPHIAFYSQEALERILEESAENITSFLSGMPRNVC